MPQHSANSGKNKHDKYIKINLEIFVLHYSVYYNKNITTKIL